MATKVISVPSSIERPITDGSTIYRNMDGNTKKNVSLADILQEELDKSGGVSINTINLPKISSRELLSKLLSQLVIRFDTNPDYYTKSDYRLLVAVLAGALPQLYEQSAIDIDLDNIKDSDLLTEARQLDLAINELYLKIQTQSTGCVWEECDFEE